MIDEDEAGCAVRVAGCESRVVRYELRGTGLWAKGIEQGDLEPQFLSSEICFLSSAFCYLIAGCGVRV